MIKLAAASCMIGIALWAVAQIPSPQSSFALQPSHSDTIRVILDPLHKTQLSAEVSSTVVRITKKMGERFDKGEILIQLDDAIFIAHQEEAAADLEKTKTNLSAKKQLFQQDSASLLQVKEAEADVAAAHAKLVLATQNVNACTILGPYNGKVVDISVEEFELAKVGDPLMKTVDDSILIAKLLVPSDLWNSLKREKVLQIQIKETNTVEQAVIKRIGAIIDPSSSTIRVDAEIDNSDGRLQAGMTGTTTIQG
jgi:membrane fusion protein (multidrug efflux system)